jgi:hypothetical protein
MTGRTSMFVVGMVLLSGCGSPEVDVEAEEQRLMELSRKWSDAPEVREANKVAIGALET